MHSLFFYKKKKKTSFVLFSSFDPVRRAVMTTVAAESKLRDAKAKLLKANNQVVRENSQLLGRLRTAEVFFSLLSSAN